MRGGSVWQCAHTTGLLVDIAQMAQQLLDVVDTAVQRERILRQPSLGQQGAGKKLLGGVTSLRGDQVQSLAHVLRDVVGGAAVPGPQEPAGGQKVVFVFSGGEMHIAAPVKPPK